MPPTKLNPFRTGSSKSSGEPEIKYTMIGKIKIEAKLIRNNGYCFHVNSCFFLAHLEKNMAKIIVKKIVAKT